MSSNNDHQRSQQNKGFILGIIAITAFGLTLPATRYIVPYLDPVFIALGRASVAAVFAACILLITKSPIPTKAQLGQLSLVALGVVIGFPLLTAWAMQIVPASHGGVVIAILPLATVLAGRLISTERPSIGFYMVSIVGMAIVVFFTLFSDNNAGFNIGDVALIFSVICAAFGYAVGGKLSTSMAGWRVICWALVISLPFVILPTIVSAPKDFSALPTSAWFAFGYLSLISQLFGFFIWYHALALGGITRVSQTLLLQPFVTLFAAAILLGERLSSELLVYAFLVLLCVAIGKRMPIGKAQ